MASDITGYDEVFMEIYRRHRRRVHRWLTRSLGAVLDREDVTQEVFMQLYRALPSYRGEATMVTFLYTITLNVSNSHKRKQGRQLPLSSSSMVEDQMDEAPTPEDLLRRKQQLEKLIHLGQFLPQNLRLPFQLVFLENLSYAAAAERLGLRATQVKQRVAKARKKLLAMLSTHR